MIKKRIVPIPEKKRVVLGGRPVMIGTKNVAPNIAAMCWIPTPIVSGQAKRSSGFTTPPSLIDFPFPCSFHDRRDIAFLSVCLAQDAARTANGDTERLGVTLRYVVEKHAPLPCTVRMCSRSFQDF
jgi:hypothetical protein